MNVSVGRVVLVVAVVLATAFVYLIAHEGTHLALASKPTGVCFGVCGAGGQGSGPQIANAWGMHNELSVREDIPTVVGAAFGLAFAFLCFLALLDKTSLGAKEEVGEKK